MAPELIPISVDDASKVTNLETLLAWCRLSMVDWDKVRHALGEPELDDMPTIGNIPDADWIEATAGLKAFGSIPRTRLGLLIAMARMKVGKAPRDYRYVPKEPPVVAAGSDSSVTVAASAAAGAAAAAVIAPDKNLIRTNLVFDQGLKLSCAQLSTAGIDEMRARWFTWSKLEPMEHLNLTDTQLSVLHFLNARGSNVLAFDMGVWGPMAPDGNATSS